MKRSLDFLLALLGILLLWPVMAVVATAVRFSSSGPVLIQQRRVGFAGCVFTVLKFRTMVENAHLLGTSVTTGNDPRITPVGRFLRKTKMDELPQLFNVMVGDMSFVGPRPDVPEIIAKYTPEMRRVLEIRPGITSLATLHFRNEEELLAKVPNHDDFYEKTVVPLKVKLAMEHVERDSFLFDFHILLQTVWMVTPFGRLFPVAEHPLVTELKRSLVKV